MTIKETMGWLKIMRTNLKYFPEICNGETANAPEKIEALSNAIEIVECFEAFTDPNVSDEECYKIFEKVRKRNEHRRNKEVAYDHESKS